MLKPRIFRVFVSSTFSDLVQERNALQVQVFPELRKLCAQHDARFQTIDFRWGISQEAALDQRVVSLCLNEIARCQRITKRPNFILLLGDRYGWLPLPESIPANEFEVLEGLIQTEKVLLNEWYKRDENAIPVEYALQARRGEYSDYSRWREAERCMHDALTKALKRLDWTTEQRIRYETSITEQEIMAGIFNNPNAEQAAFCFFRHIEAGSADASQFIDPDPQARAKLADLKQRLHKHLPHNVQQYKAKCTGDGITTDHINQLCNDVYTSLSRVILSELATFQHTSSLNLEREAHLEFMRERTRHFVGRMDNLQTIAQYIDNKCQKSSVLKDIRILFIPKAKKGQNCPLVLHGPSGVGKSTIIARAISVSPSTIYRFIGVTPDSTDIRLLLMSICQEIVELHHTVQSIPSDYDELIKTFAKLLALASANNPITIFLDALDQLSTSNTPDNLRWLPHELPPNVKLIVSAIPSPILSELKLRYPDAMLSVLPMQEEDAERLLALWLNDAKRTLTQTQRSEVLNNFAQNGLPLYLKLAFEEARLWRSYEQKSLYSDISSLIRDNLFARLSSSSEHGELLISRSMAYLSASRNGLSEDELLEVLAIDEEYWKGLSASAFHILIARQVPIVLWSRLAFDLAPYMIERNVDNSALLSFYHRQFGEAVDALYLKDLRETFHAQLAHYFESQDLYTNEFPNARKVSEQAYQQAKANLHGAFVATLMDCAFLQVGIELRGVQALIEDCELMQDKTVSLVASALDLSRQALEIDTEQVSSQLFGRLGLYPECDSLTKAAEIIETSRPHLKLLLPTLEPAGKALLRTLEGHTDKVQAVALQGDIALSASKDGTLKVWDWRAGTLVRTLDGHKDTEGRVETVYGVALQGEIAVSASLDTTLKVWNWQTGKLLRTLEGHSSTVYGVALQGEIAISASNDSTLKVWNWQTGKLLRTLEGHTYWVAAVAVQGEFAVSASGDKTLKVWNWYTGKLLRTLEGHGDGIMAVALQGDTAISASGSTFAMDIDNSLKVWDWQTGKLIRTLHGHTSNIYGVALQGEIAVSASLDYSLRVWNWQTGTLLRTLKRHTYEVNGVALQGNIAVSASGDRTLQVWNWHINEREPSTRETVRKLEEHTDDIIDLALQGNIIVSASEDGTLKVWDWQTGKLIRTLQGHKSHIRTVKLHGEIALSASWDKTLKVWNWQTGTLLRTLQGDWGSVNEVAVQREFAVSASGDTTLKVWNWQIGKLLRTLEGHTNWVSGVALQGEIAVSASLDTTLKVWNWQTGKLLRTLEGHRGSVNKVALEGEIAISASNDSTLKVWNWQTGKLLRTLEGHTYWVAAVAVQGEFAVSASGDKTLKVWNWYTGRMITHFDADYPQKAVAIAPNLECIVSAGAFGKMHFLRPNRVLRELLMARTSH